MEATKGYVDKTKKPDKSEQRTYLKIKATFKCTSDKCNKLWTSVHAWERKEDVFCEKCSQKADVDKCELKVKLSYYNLLKYISS